MPVAITEASGRLEIREGGGGLTLFGLPFLAAGIFVLLTGRAEGFIGVLFILIGAIIAFGRHVTALDLGQQVAIEQWRLFIPIRSRTYQLRDYGAVTITLERGDADSADRYPVALKARSGRPLVLCRPTQYAEARAGAAAVARHLDLHIEDASTGSAIRIAASDAEAPLQQRLRSTRAELTPVPRPPAMRSEVTDLGSGVRIDMPVRRLHVLVAVTGVLFPGAMAMGMLGWLGFFSRGRALTPGDWIFLGALVVGFVMLPTAVALNGWVRSRVGRLIVTVSTQELRIEERGPFRTRPVAAFDASEIFDVDVRTSGIVVKTRKGLTTFGEGLADDENRYLHAIVLRALR